MLYLVRQDRTPDSSASSLQLIMSAVRSSLSREQERQLSSLFGQVKLSLLYKASVHGYTAAAFHGRCDLQGPTVVVAYNHAGFVYGAYTSRDYAQSGQYVADERAFLFSFGGERAGQSPLRYTPKLPEQAFQDGNTGPNFGALLFLKDNTAAVACTPGVLYNFAPADVHGDDPALEECEVYRVEDLGGLLEKPWRNVLWNSGKRKELLDFVKNYRPMMKGVQQARILLVGPVGVGKSSFFNSINSIFRGHVTSQAIAGSAVKSLTSQFRSYRVKAGREGKPLPFVVCDTMGLEAAAGEGLHLDDITSILRGHVVDRYQFNPRVPLLPDSLGYRKNPSLCDMIHCVVYVLDSTKLNQMTPKLWEKLTDIRSKVNLLGVPQLVLMTKVDEACHHVGVDLKQVYSSHFIDRKVQELGVFLGIPISCIIPVKNYSQELELDPSTDLLLLSAVQQMLRFADNYFDDIYLGADEHCSE
ncbi:interferon-induced protein 44-like isoform X1 [Conger conger]|uniref:interferon-induced protein 44-like isoform X1 n=2 Tax=Conger conger TaxID=82655 RepID=UPI002A5A0A79|nr:interferon-induced protein 44-like isoform X1 [Conger conger]